MRSKRARLSLPATPVKSLSPVLARCLRPRSPSQAQVCGARVVPEAAVEFGSHTVLEAYFEGCGTVRATLVE